MPQDLIYQSIQRDFAGCAEARDLLARQHASDPLTLPALAMLRAYSDAVEALPSAQMRQLLIKSLIEQLDVVFHLGNAAASELQSQALQQAYTEVRLRVSMGIIPGSLKNTVSNMCRLSRLARFRSKWRWAVYACSCMPRTWWAR